MKFDKNRAALASLFWIPGLALFGHAAQAQEHAPSAKVVLRMVILTESDGSNPAAGPKQIERQIAQLRADGERHGLQFVMKAATFVADSARRHADGDTLTRNAAKDDPNFAPSRDEIVIYVTDLGRGAAATPFVLRTSADTSSMPAIVIDASEFGGEGCGPTKAAPCRALTLAIAEALTAHGKDTPLRDAAQNMRKGVVEAGRD